MEPHLSDQVGSEPAGSAGPQVASLRRSAWLWLRIGCVSFGGPAGQIALLHREFVDERRWLSERRFLHALSFCMLLPGPEAQQLATYIGWLTHRTRGALVAGGLFVLPSLFLMIALSWVYVTFGDTSIVAGILAGVTPAIVAVVLFAAYRIGTRVLHHPALVALAALALAAMLLRIPFPLIIGAAAAAGWLLGRLRPSWLSGGSSHAPAGGATTGAVHDDSTRSPDHTRTGWRRTALVLGVGVLAWLVPVVALTALFGWDGTLTQMAWFFTKAALLTFGGAYAVLPYVYQGAVEQYGWVTPKQMIDGLALGESTPGPLIMVVTFVGFLGGAAADPLADPMWSGVTAAVLVTYFTFLPSFVFILAGGPWVERSRDDVRMTAPLTGISAAVVGVVLNLAVVFAQTALFPGGWTGGLDVAAAVILVASAVALFVVRWSVIVVIALAAAAGLILTLVR